MGVFAYRNQPFRGIFLTYQTLTTLLVRLPLWLVISLPKSWRPRASWTVRRCVLMRVVRHLMYVNAGVGPIVAIPNHLAVHDGPDIKAVWVEPTPDLITGPVATWASAANVKPIRIPGYWLDKRGADIPVNQKPVPGEKVVYCLHGGAYTSLSAFPGDVTAPIARGILQHCKPIQRAFSLEYRLSSAAPYVDAHPFPAALIDAIAGYNYLVHTVGFAPADIVVEGDSAGGNLVLALTRYLVQHASHPGLPSPPGAIILLSPWSDIGTSHEGPTKALDVLSMDYLNSLQAPHGLWCRAAFIGPHGMDAALRNPYISPASLALSADAVRFKGFPKTFIVAGGAERLYDMIVTLKERMVADMGEGSGEGQVEFYEAVDAVHDYLLLRWHEPERTETLRAIAKWLEQ